MKGKSLLILSVLLIAGMGALVDSVAVYTNEEDAIGYSYYYYVTDMWENDKVKQG